MQLSEISALRSNLSHLRRQLVVGNLVCLVVVALAVALAAKSSYDGHQDRARQAAISLVQALSQNVAESLGQIDHALLSTLRQVDRLELHGPLTVQELGAVADEQRALVPGMTALRFTDDQGWVLNAGDQPGVSVADRDYFRAAQAHPEHLAVSDPLQGRIQAGWGIVLARARMSPDGRFLGVVYGVITATTFNEKFQRAPVGPHGAVALRTIALKLVARYSSVEENPYLGVDTSQVSDALRAAVAADPSHGSFRTWTVLDNTERVTAYAQVPGYAMLLAAGLATDDFLQPWWRQLWVIGAVALLLQALVTVFSRVIYHAHRTQEQTGEQIGRLAQERGLLLDNELVGMVKLHDRHEVWHNKALARLFGYESGELNGTPTRRFYLDDESYARVGAAYAAMAAGKTFRTQLQMARKDGSSIWIDLSGAALDGGDSLWLMVDIDAVKRSEEHARFLAFHDALTGLPNRHLLAESLEFLLRGAERRRTGLLAVCYLDLDGFKAVNDVHGHDAGDEVLRVTALRLKASVRANDIVARVGGDEFVVVLNQPDMADGVEQALGRLMDAFKSPVILPSGAEVSVGVSIGVALYPQHAQTATGLITLADHAMLASKAAGKGRWVLHSPT